MPIIEFRDQESGQLLACVKDCSIIPAVGDRIYVPSVADAGAYSHCRVTLRELYYDQQGRVAMVKLACDAATS